MSRAPGGRRALARAGALVALVAASFACAAAWGCARAAAFSDPQSGHEGVVAVAAVRILRGRTAGYDRTYKADLVERLMTPPELVVLGGSRAQRFEPSVIRRLTGLSAFNFALQNCRPEDAYAVSRLLFARSPSQKLHCVYAVQGTTFSDVDMNPGLLYDARLACWFPETLIAEQKRARGAVNLRSLLSCNRFSPRGCLLENTYDEREAAGQTLDESLSAYLGSLLSKAASTETVAGGRAKTYFRKLLALYNAHGVRPLILIMPYQPIALSAFRAVGWQTKLERLKTYLTALQSRYDFRVLDCTDIETFGGCADGFYDGAHIKRENARRLLRYAVRAAPGCFR